MVAQTHAAVGSLAALIVARPISVQGALWYIIVGASYGIFPDIDLPNSKTSQILKRFVPILCFVQILQHYLKSGSLGFDLREHLDLLWQAPSLVLLAVFIVFGSVKPHRGFTHSVIALTIVSFSAFLYNVQFGKAAMMAYASHLLVDLPNKRGEQLLWPLDKKYCLNLCKSDGIISRVVQVVSVCACIVLLLSLGSY